VLFEVTYDRQWHFLELFGENTRNTMGQKSEHRLTFEYKRIPFTRSLWWRVWRDIL
jgi:hypothetical protein